MNKFERSEEAGSIERQVPVRRGGTPEPKLFYVQTLMDFVGTASDEQFAELAGVDRRTVQRWKRSGLDCWQVDRLCVTVGGVHPASVYGWFWFISEDFAIGA